MAVTLIQSGRFGAAAWSPTDLPSLVGWWDATVGVTGTPTVTAWENQAGALDFTSGSATTDATTQNGLNVLDFDGSANYLQLADTSTLTTSGVYTVALSVASRTRVTNRHFCDKVSGAGERCLVSCDTNWRAYSGAAVIDSGVAGDTSWHYVVVVFNGTSSKIRLDGSEIYGGATSPGTDNVNGATGGPRGWGIGTGQDGNYQHCSFGEIIIDDSALSGSDLTDMETYLSDRWIP